MSAKATDTTIDVTTATVINWTDIDGETGTGAFLIDGNGTLLIGNVNEDGTVDTAPMSWGPIEEEDWDASPVYGKFEDVLRDLAAKNPGATVSFPHPVGHADLRKFINDHPLTEYDLADFS